MTKVFSEDVTKKMSSLLPESDVRSLIQERLMDYVETLRRFIRQPSISADGTGIEAMADLLAQEMDRLAIETKVLKLSAKANPVVLGTLFNPENHFTLLVYGHYDVHPVGNLAMWKFNPFSADLIEDRIYGRGAADNKGNFLSWIKAIQLLREVDVHLPINIIFVFEGEEEIGSPHLGEFVLQYKDLLSKANAKVVFEPRQDTRGKAFINLGWKGSLSLKLTAESKSGQIHASYASFVLNPAWELINAVHSMTDGINVVIPRFYEKVVKPSQKEKELVAQLQWDKEDLLSALGGESVKEIKQVGGYELRGPLLRERMLLEPSFIICAFSSGSVEPPVKGVIPAEASCLLQFRLVPHQKCAEIVDLVKKHLRNDHNYYGIEVEVLSATEPSRTPADSQFVEYIRNVCQMTFAETCDVYPSLQGASPDYLFTDILNIPSVGCGCGYHHLCHRPNEYITIPQFSKGIELAVNILLNVGDKSLCTR